MVFVVEQKKAFHEARGGVRTEGRKPRHESRGWAAQISVRKHHNLQPSLSGGDGIGLLGHTSSLAPGPLQVRQDLLSAGGANDRSSRETPHQLHCFSHCFSLPLTHSHTPSQSHTCVNAQCFDVQGFLSRQKQRHLLSCSNLPPAAVFSIDLLLNTPPHPHLPLILHISV